MPSHKSKKSSSARSSVEKSKEMDLKPLTEFVDDRVELIRHAFMCLKPKTIKNIAPDFLKGKSVDKLQEICLDEVLGLSTKRLLAIINATVCPSDTESSDSDVPKIIEDHISLSEISSDDDMLEEISSKKVKKLHKKRAIKKEKDPEGKKMKNGRSGEASTSAAGAPENQMSEKEMTVLELLELQARARAIRSQLALEPVTKIELDSDDSGGEKEKTVEKAPEVVTTTSEPKPNSKKPSKSSVNEGNTTEVTKDKENPKTSTKKPSKSATNETEKSKEPEPRTKEKETPSKASTSKDRHSSGTEDRHKSDKRKRSTRSRSKEKSPILDLRAKIEQRRNQNQSMEEKTDNGEKPRRRLVLRRNFGTQITVTTENSNASNADTRSSDKNEQQKASTSGEKVKQEPGSDRESSPDVIAMHPSPETILLTSSDEEQESIPNEKPKQVPKEKSPRSIREKSPGTLSLEAEELDYDEKLSEPETEDPKKSSNEQEKNQSKEEAVDKKSPDGSESEEEEERDDWEDTIDVEVEKVSSEATVSQEQQDPPEDSISINNSQASISDTKPESSTQDPETSPVTTTQDIVDVGELPEKIESQSSSSSSSSSDYDEEPNLGKTDVDKDPEKSEDDADVVTIDINESSDEGKLNDDEENNQSWGQRWLRSKKVSKVMTSTKLGNKLRSKAKEKKIEEKKAVQEKERLEKLEQDRLAEEERKKVEEEKKASEVPEDVLGSTKHFKDLKLLSKLREEREQRAAKEAVRKSKKK